MLLYRCAHACVSALYLVGGILGCLPYLGFDMYLIILVPFLFYLQKYTIMKLFVIKKLVPVK
jgi:membrane-anchored protein YejM (alkaline phosphatase superfamily)